MSVSSGDEPPVRGAREALRSLRLSAPLHPILVHFSIALTSASFAFDAAARLFRRASLAEAGWWTIAAAALVTVATIGTGLVSRARVPIEESEARSYLRAHMALGPMFFGLLVAMAIWRGNFWQSGSIVSWTYVAAMAGLLVVITAQGFLGGELVYRYGVEVRGHFRALPVTKKSAPPKPAPIDAPWRQ